MATKKRGLGRGLNELLASAKAAPVALADLPAADQDEAQSPSKSIDAGGPGAAILKKLPVDLMQRGKYQPRLDMHPETLQELADSIKAQGVVQPIVVRPIDGKRYEIIAGERRWRASQMAGLHEVPCIIRDVPDQAAMAMALIENIQREDLNPMEEAGALLRLIQEFELTHQQTADAVGRSRAAVSNLLRLLELEDEVKTMLEHGDMEMGHARALLALAGEQQRSAARTVVAKGMSVRETEQLVRRLQAESGGQKPVVREDPDIRQLQDELSQRIGAAVKFQHGASGKGKLVIQYSSLDELDGILAHIK
ncbi:MAG: ParB/RepB/Spo0J family partition protein [Pseudomonadota bacterium]|nr:ParB/RepB/Spo0J family partition protein [Pseudomonadota bacterium]